MAVNLIRDHSKRLFVGSEASFGAGPAAIIAATDACRHIEADITAAIKREIANDEATGNRGGYKPISGAVDPVSLGLKLPLVGSGTATTAPDFAPLLKAAGLTETVGGSDVTYAKDPTAATAGEYSAWAALINADKSAADYFAGVAVQDVTLPSLGTQGARIEFGCMAARGSHMQRTVVGTGGISDVATSLPLGAGHGWIHNGVDFTVEITDGTNSERVKVTAIDATVSPNVATITRAHDGGTSYAFAAGDTIRAFIPSSFTVSSQEIIGDRLGSITLNDGGGAVELEFYDGSLKVGTGHTLDEKPAFETYRQRVVASRYQAPELEINHPLLAGTTGSAKVIRYAEDRTNVAAILTIGATAGNRLVVTLPTAVLTTNAPRTGDGMRKATTIARGYSTTGADVTLAFT
jgi:hypothetical protein